MREKSKKTILEFDKNSRESFEMLGKKLKDNGLDPANVDLFVYAMAYGFLNGNKVDSIQRSGTGPRVQYIKPEHEILMYAIQFSEIVKKEIARIQTTQGLFTREEYGENLIHFSALPWIKFDSFSHARSFTWPDSCPKISFGKITEEKGKKTMPISIHVHYGLMDGYHVGLFIEHLEELMNG